MRFTALNSLKGGAAMSVYSDEELERMLDDLESDLVERKESFRGDVPKKARQAVCAFSNDLPDHNRAGVLFIGAGDAGQPSGYPVSDELLRSLAYMKTDGNILPLPVCTVEKRSLKGSEMAVVTVFPSDMPPVKYEGRIWVRTGSRRSIANEQEERILSEKRRYKNLPFDLHPVPEASLNDLSKVLFESEYLPAAFAPEILEANNRTYEERLASCRMIVSPDNPVPTLVGILALGKRPRAFFPGASVQFLRIDGEELADPVIDEENVDGPLREMLSKIGQKLSAHNRVFVDIVSSPTEKRTYDYPPPSLQQLLYNAVLHRTYEKTNTPVRIYWFNDRIEIISPGGPYGNVTRENFGRPGITDYRNPNLAEVMKVFGFVQAFGRGIAVARRALEANGSSPLEFEVDRSAVKAVVHKHPKKDA